LWRRIRGWRRNAATPGGVDPREGLRDDAIVRGASIATLHRDMMRPCTQGSPAKPGSALGYLPVRPQRASEAFGDS
jgi:hypothetical protein